MITLLDLWNTAPITYVIDMMELSMANGQCSNPAGDLYKNTHIIGTLRLRQNCCQFTDAIFNIISMYRNRCILIHNDIWMNERASILYKTPEYKIWGPVIFCLSLNTQDALRMSQRDYVYHVDHMGPLLLTAINLVLGHGWVVNSVFSCGMWLCIRTLIYNGG